MITCTANIISDNIIDQIRDVQKRLDQAIFERELIKDCLVNVPNSKAFNEDLAALNIEIPELEAFLDDLENDFANEFESF